MKVMGHHIGAVLVNLEAMDESGVAENLRYTLGFGSKRLHVICIGFDLGIAQIPAKLPENEMRKVVESDGVLADA